MNRYFFLSCVLHLLLALAVVGLVGGASSKSKATYTIDFIGSGKVVSMQQAQAASAASQAEAKKGEVQKETVQTPPAAKKQEAKPNKKAYQSKEEISAKKQPKKKKPAPAPEPLPGPSVLDETAKENSAASTGPNGEGEFEGGNIQTDFATFPYPWYITQVRNSLWSQWEKRRPAGVVRGAMVTFAIARDGKIRNLEVQKSSGDDSFDFAATSAVINAGPFPPLPMLYEKDELTVTVEFKQES